MKLDIGAKVWKFESNHRVYRQQNGHSVGGPIWREHWRPCCVIGETSRTYIVGISGSSYEQGRIPKKDLREGTLSGWAISERDIEEAAYIHDNAYKIAEHVQRCKDFHKLTEIAGIVGFNPPT